MVFRFNEQAHQWEMWETRQDRGRQLLFILELPSREDILFWQRFAAATRALV